LANLLTLTKSQPVRTLATGEALVEAGEAGGELYVLQSGRLSVEREGMQIATISEPGSLIGEMSVLLGDDHSATVRAVSPVEVRVIENAIAFLESTPIVALHVATMVCQRLEATSALLVEIKKEAAEGRGEQSFLERIFGAVSGTGTQPR
jgi:CRP-like cAMP-binding protein